MSIFELLFKLVLSHFIGDYFLQTDYLAKNKGTDKYILLAHCILYILPFYLFFGFTWHLMPLFVLHIFFDWLKATKNKTTLWQDQVIHFITALLYLI